MGPREAPRPTRAKRPSGLAARLTAARLAAGLTQAQAAEELGVALRTYTGWEHGPREPTIKLHLAAVDRFLAKRRAPPAK